MIKNQEEAIKYDGVDLKLFKVSKVLSGNEHTIQQDELGNYVIYKFKGILSKKEAEKWLDDVSADIKEVRGEEAAEMFHVEHMKKFGLLVDDKDMEVDLMESADLQDEEMEAVN